VGLRRKITVRSGGVLAAVHTTVLDVHGGLRAIKFYQLFDCEEVKARTMLASQIADTGVSPENDVMGYSKPSSAMQRIQRRGPLGRRMHSRRPCRQQHQCRPAVHRPHHAAVAFDKLADDGKSPRTAGVQVLGRNLRCRRGPLRVIGESDCYGS
jgi:hypothetical protein